MATNSRVLIVDDEPSIREQLSVGLAQRGFEIEASEKSTSALECLEAARRRNEPHDYLVIDLRLPDINGLRMLEVIKTTYPELRIVAISGFGGEFDTEKIFTYEGCGYLDKPFAIDDLTRELERLGPAIETPRPYTSRQKAVSPHAQSAYVLVRAASPGDLDRTFDALYCADGVCYCDKVLGTWDIVLLVQAKSSAELDEIIKERIRTAPGVDSAQVIRVCRPKLSDGIGAFVRNYERMLVVSNGRESAINRRERKMQCAYALLSLDKTKLEALYPRLYFNPRVLYCDITGNNDGAVLLLQAHTPNDLERVVTSVQHEPGVQQATVLSIIDGLN